MVKAATLTPENVPVVAVWCGGTPLVRDGEFIGIRLQTRKYELSARIGDVILFGELATKGHFEISDAEVFNKNHTLERGQP